MAFCTRSWRPEGVSNGSRCQFARGKVHYRVKGKNQDNTFERSNGTWLYKGCGFKVQGLRKVGWNFLMLWMQCSFIADIWIDQVKSHSLSAMKLPDKNNSN